MKKKVFSLVLIMALFIGGTVGALVYHIQDAEQALKEELTERIPADKEWVKFQVKNDTSSVTDQEIERLKTEVEEHYNNVKNQYQTEQLQEKAEEIKQETDAAIERLKKFINEEFGVEYSEPKG
jgi:predicted GTPase